MSKTRPPKRTTVFSSAAPAAPPQEPQKLSAQELGPAVTQEFTDALGLEAAGGGTNTRRPGTAAAPGSASAPASPSPGLSVEETKKLLLDLVGLIDQAVSVALKIEPEKLETLQTPVTCMAPWVAAHAGDVTSETGMRLLAISGLLTFVAMKVIKWAQKPTPVKPRPDVATAADDLDDADLATLAEGRD